MLSSHSWWKWSEPTMTSTSGLARVSVSRNAVDLADPLVGERWAVRAGGGAGLVVERMVGRGDDRDDLGHARVLSARLAGDVAGVAVHGAVDLQAEAGAALLGELAEQPGGAGQQREAAQQLDRQAEVGEGRAADAGAVERQRAAEDRGWTRPIASNSRRCGPRSPSSSAMRIRTGVRGSCTLCTGCPRPGTNLPAARRAVIASAATASQPASSAGAPGGRPARRAGRPRSPR